MKRPGARTSFLLLALLTVAAWALPVWELVHHGLVSIVSVVTAVMLTSMLVAWPFLNGTRIARGHLTRAAMCVECHALRWPAEKTIGFCLRCGSTRVAVPAGY